ncbi:MAG: insulinase family protein [Chitinophagales bacterium]|nr:insulinase family protein [Chitinophagales bacterium]
MLQVPTNQKDMIDKGLLILQDWADGLTIPQEEVVKERGVVFSEWRSSLGPQERMMKQYMPVLFRGSRYTERLPIGDTSIIKNANRDAIERFYKDWYRPDLMAVAIVGDFDPKEIEKEVIAGFSTIPSVKDEREKKIYEVPPHQEPLVSIITDKEAPYTQIITFEKHPAESNDNMIGYRDYLKYSIINNVLNERFKEKLQQPNPPFFMAMADYDNQVRTLDAFTGFAIGSADKTEDMLKVLYEEIYRIRKFGITQGELDRAVADIKNNYETALKEKDKTESSVYADEYVNYFLKGDAAPGIEIENQLVQMLSNTFSLNEINNTVKKLITGNNSVVIITAPEADKDKLPSEKRVLEIRQEVALSDIQAKTEDAVSTQLIDKTPDAGAIVSREKDTHYNIDIWTLSNGAKVYIKPTDFQNDEILFQAYSPGGSSLYSDKDYYTISNTSPIINQSGFGNFNALQLNKALSGKNVKSTSFISDYSEGISASSSPKDLETLFQLVYLNFTAPRYDSLIFQSYISKNKSLFSNLLVHPSYYFQKTYIDALYDHNLRKSFPNTEDFDKIELDKIVAFYKERFDNASDFNFIIVGNVNEDSLETFVKKYLASLPATQQKENWKDTGIRLAAGKTDVEVAKGAAPKTNVLFAYNGTESWSKENDILLDMLSSVLNIKLRESLREDKGGVYGVGVRGSFSRIPTSEYSLLINYNTDPDQAEDLENETLKVIEEVKDKGVDDVTLNKIKEQIKRGIEVDLKTNEFWVGAIKESIVYKEPIENTDEYLKAIQAVTSDDIQKAANHFINENRKVRVVMSPEK